MNTIQNYPQHKLALKLDKWIDDHIIVIQHDYLGEEVICVELVDDVLADMLKTIIDLELEVTVLKHKIKLLEQ